MSLRKRLICYLILAVLAMMLPLISSNLLIIAIPFLYYLILSSSWNLIMGYTGLFSFGHMGMSLIGGYGSALLVLKLDLPPFLGIFLGGLAAAIVSLILGLICLRLRGFYLTLVTWAFAEMLIIFLRNESELTGGTMGLLVPGLFSAGKGIEHYYYAGLGIVLVFSLSLILLISSRYGVYLQSIRDDEEASEVMGVNTIFWKMFAFTFSGFWAGIAGAFYAHYLGVIDPSAGSLTILSMVFLMVVIGGIGTLIGPVIGTAFVVYLSEVFSGSMAEYSILVFAIFMIITMRFFRGGLSEAFSLLYRWIIARKSKLGVGKENT